MEDKLEFKRQDGVKGDPSGFLKMNGKEMKDMENPDVQAAVERLMKYFKLDEMPHKAEKLTDKNGKEYWALVPDREAISMQSDKNAGDPMEEPAADKPKKKKKPRKKVADSPVVDEPVPEESDSPDDDASDEKA